MTNRSINFSDREHNRYWWYRTPNANYIPLIYDFLNEQEWSLLREWFEDTEKKFESTGEAGVPPVSLIAGLVSGNGINRIVQCGHYIGYSTLLLGFLLRRMGKVSSLYSIDIDPIVTKYTYDWLLKADLQHIVNLEVSDSAGSDQPMKAKEYLGGQPQLVFIDSSHQYQHTLEELSLWYSELVIGGFIILHDTSQYASIFDKTHKGGVSQAVNEWCATRNIQKLNLNGFVNGGTPGDYPYLDGCGVTIIQKWPEN